MIRTSTFLPFNNSFGYDSFFNHLPENVYVRFTVPAHTQEEKEFLKKYPFPKEYYHKNFITKDINLKTGESFITRCLDSDYPYDKYGRVLSSEELKEIEKINKEFITRRRNNNSWVCILPTNERRYIKKKMLLMIKDDLIIMRFFEFICGSWFFQNKPPTWFEVFRIVIGKNEAWTEKEESCIPFNSSNISRLVYNGFENCMFEEHVTGFFEENDLSNEDIDKVLEILSAYSGYRIPNIANSFFRKNSKTDVNKKMVMNELLYFILSSTRDRETIYKYYPVDLMPILNELDKNNDSLYKESYYISVDENTNTNQDPFIIVDAFGDDSFESIGEKKEVVSYNSYINAVSRVDVVYEEYGKYLVARLFRLGHEKERTFFSKNGVYCFEYNPIKKKWFSKIARYSLLFTDRYSGRTYPYQNLTRPNVDSYMFYYRNKSKGFCCNEKMPDDFYDAISRIFGTRVNLPEKCNPSLIGKYFYLQLLYKWGEQACKMRFFEFINDVSFDTVSKENTYKNINGISNNLMIEKDASISDILCISPKCLKYLDKNFSLYSVYNYSKYSEVLDFLKSLNFEDVFIAQNIYYLMKCRIDSLRSFYNYAVENRRSPERMIKNMIKTYKENVSTCLDYYADYASMRIDAEKLGSFKYPEFIKVKDIKFYHDKANRDCMAYRQLVRAKSNNIIFANMVAGPEYQDLCYRNDKFIIIAPKQAEDLVDEGRILHHCVGSYIGRVASGQTKIYFLRKAENPDEPYYTVEIRNSNGVNSMRQCYGSHDHIGSNVDRKEFIEEWAKAKKIKIDCRYFNSAQPIENQFENIDNQFDNVWLDGPFF